jgi:hypothetical protein
MATWQKQLKDISMALAVVGGIWMALSVGITDVLNAIFDPDSVDAQTASELGGIDFVDRIAIAGVVLTLLSSAGLGVISVSGGNPPFLNVLIRYQSTVIAFIALSAFSTEVFDLLTANRDWSTFTDIQNSYLLFLSMSVLSGVAGLLMNRR